MPLEIQVPAAGPVTLPGRTLRTRTLADFARDADSDLPPGVCAERRVLRAWSEGQILCARPTAARPAKFGMSKDEALDEIYHDQARVIAVDPYTMDGAPIRHGRTLLTSYAA